MTIYIQTEQAFSVTYAVDADTPEEAWQELMNGNATNTDQSPGDIIGKRKEAHFEDEDGNEIQLAPYYGMFSDEGNAAVADMIERMKRVANNPGVTNKDTFIIAGRPIYHEVAKTHPEVGDTAVREMYCPALDEIMREHGWAFESWEGYF
jgi:hypothetical protein